MVWRCIFRRTCPMLNTRSVHTVFGDVLRHH